MNDVYIFIMLVCWYVVMVIGLKTIIDKLNEIIKELKDE